MTKTDSALISLGAPVHFEVGANGRFWLLRGLRMKNLDLRLRGMRLICCATARLSLWIEAAQTAPQLPRPKAAAPASASLVSILRSRGIAETPLKLCDGPDQEGVTSCICG